MSDEKTVGRVFRPAAVDCKTSAGPILKDASERSRKVRERVQGRHVGDTYSLPETLSPFGRIKKGGF